MGISVYDFHLLVEHNQSYIGLQCCLIPIVFCVPQETKKKKKCFQYRFGMILGCKNVELTKVSFCTIPLNCVVYTCHHVLAKI